MSHWLLSWLVHWGNCSMFTIHYNKMEYPPVISLIAKNTPLFFRQAIINHLSIGHLRKKQMFNNQKEGTFWHCSNLNISPQHPFCPSCWWTNPRRQFARRGAWCDTPGWWKCSFAMFDKMITIQDLYTASSRKPWCKLGLYVYVYNCNIYIYIYK